ncbi:hypothetical protein IFM89_039230 [Coptis chinensis]|uniref:Uncharacterized protein n=1 Tax=Coptis chinensis TaxID=261450 RepID=A0A835IK46_9MAGN|nr:hypothetical protein IFM89_039230 [Coptis chinensis]
MTNVSLLGHLCGILSGYAYTYGLFNVLLHGSSFYSTIESSSLLSTCVRRPKFILCTGGNPSGYMPTHTSPNSPPSSLISSNIWRNLSSWMPQRETAVAQSTQDSKFPWQRQKQKLRLCPLVKEQFPMPLLLSKRIKLCVEIGFKAIERHYQLCSVNSMINDILDIGCSVGVSTRFLLRRVSFKEKLPGWIYHFTFLLEHVQGEGDDPKKNPISWVHANGEATDLPSILLTLSLLHM